jgi:hypothetical protein
MLRPLEPQSQALSAKNALVRATVRANGVCATSTRFKLAGKGENVVARHFLRL